MRVAVIGAGVSGLGVAINLAHDGHEVVVLERDATPLPTSADDAFEWNRRGAPQVRHSHAFLARGRNLIRDRLPAVREALLAAGVTEVAWSDMARGGKQFDPEPGDEDLAMLACRRTTFEWVLRREALETARVEIRDGSVVNALQARDERTEGAGAVRITGVQTGDGGMDADLVVDATGRPSHMHDLLSGVGALLTETKSPTGIVYLSRFYRLRDGTGPPDETTFNGADLEYLKFAVFRGDNDTFSITLAFAPEDEQLQTLRDEARFDAVTRRIETIAKWTDPAIAEPISGVHYMGGLINRIRHYVVDGEPIALGIVAVGDSSVCTNPLYGRGCSLGLAHGALLADAVRDEPDDLRALALRFDDDTKRELVPWYEASVAQDGTAMKLQRGEPLNDFETFLRSLIREGVFPAAMTDPVVSRAWFRSFNLLDSPEALMTNVEVMRRVMEVWNDRDNREPEPPAGPGREELFAAIT
jgi:2-polyprenyl-6-methoxyphenol hydroxylase-like FAD-dependent oxidoreductase